MSDAKELRKKFSSFVNGLSPVVVREQLIRAYLQMERCQQVLRGEDVEPVEMRDNGMSSDLELFYLCKKVRKELDSKCEDDIKFCIGDDVWYMFGDRVQHSSVCCFRRDVDGMCIYQTDLCHDTAECETFATLDELLDYLRENVNGDKD